LKEFFFCLKTFFFVFCLFLQPKIPLLLSFFLLVFFCVFVSKRIERGKERGERWLDDFVYVVSARTRERERRKGKRERGKGKRERGKGKRERGKGKRERGKGKRERGRGSRSSSSSKKTLFLLSSTAAGKQALFSFLFFHNLYSQKLHGREGERNNNTKQQHTTSFCFPRRRKNKKAKKPKRQNAKTPKLFSLNSLSLSLSVILYPSQTQKN
jgi:hypothetical protein